MHGRIDIELEKGKLNLWFNNFAVTETRSHYGIDEQDISKAHEKLTDKLRKVEKENPLLLFVDIIKIGAKGYNFVFGDNPKVADKDIKMYIAQADFDELNNITKYFFGALGGGR